MLTHATDAETANMDRSGMTTVASDDTKMGLFPHLTDLNVTLGDASVVC